MSRKSEGDLIMETFFLIVFAISGAFLMYQGKYEQKVDETGFFFTYTPEVIWDGKLVEKYRVENEYKFVMKVDGKHKKLENVNVDAYHNSKVGDDVSMIYTKEDNSVNGKAIALVLVLLASIWLSDAWVSVGVSSGMFGILIWFDAIVGTQFFLAIIVNTVLAQGHTLFAENQRRRIDTVRDNYESGKFFLFMSKPTYRDKDPIKWFGFIYVDNGRIYYNEADAVLNRLKGN